MDLTKVRSAYWASEEFISELDHEIGRDVIAKHGRLLLSSAPARDVVWAHNVWKDPRPLPIESISLGAKALKSLARDWALAPIANHRRATLIEEALGRRAKSKPLHFLQDLPKAGPGTWALLEPTLALASPTCTARVANGDPVFLENKKEPPSRAYLKLWEWMTLEGHVPKKDSRCLDVGACPGGWTWVLAEIGAHVTAIDKAPLDPKVARKKGVEFLSKDAFKLDPSDMGDIDWFFSDMICEPKKLLSLVEKWIESGRCRNFVCTIKFKGKTDFEALRGFLAIEGSKARHLHHNKHEVTWWLIR